VFESFRSSVNSNNRTSKCQCSIFSKKNLIIRIFCISRWSSVPINPDKSSSTLLYLVAPSFAKIIFCVCVYIYIYIYIYHSSKSYDIFSAVDEWNVWYICGKILRGKSDLLRQKLILIQLCSQQKLHEGVGDRNEDFAVTGWRLNAWDKARTARTETLTYEARKCASNLCVENVML